MFKNKIFMSIFVQDSVEVHMSLMPLYTILLETCNKEEDENLDDLYFECVNILILVMSLNTGR
jgi:hypothetical protein